MAIKLPATDMVAGESGSVIEILGGFSLRNRLNRLGIRAGGLVTVVHDPQIGGPVVVAAAGSQVALGFGMATKIVVEVER